MPLVQVDFGQGVDEKTDPKHVATGKLLEAANVRFSKNGAIEKRHGSTYLAAGGPTLVSYRDEVLSFTAEGAAASYSPAKAVQVAKGLAMQCVATRDNLGGTQSMAATMASGNGVEVYVWSDASVQSPTYDGRTWYLVRDAETGVEIVPPTPVTPFVFSVLELGARVTFVSSTNEFVIAWYSGAATISYCTLSSTFVQSSSALLITDNMVDSIFEIEAIADRVYLLYCKDTGAITLSWFSVAMAPQSSLTLDTGATYMGATGIKATDGESVWATYFYTGAGPTDYLRVACLDEATMAMRALFPLTLETSASLDVRTTGVERYTATTAVILVGYGVTLDVIRCAVPVVTTSAVITYGVANRKLFWCQPVSRPFYQGGRVYAWLYDGGARFFSPTLPERSQWSMVLVDLQAEQTAATFVGRMACGPVAPRFSKPEDVVPIGFNPSAVGSSATSQYATVGRILRSNSGRVGLTRVLADFAHASLHQSCELGEGLHTVPGAAYDGSAFVETGFAHYPEGIGISGAAASTGHMTAGDYWYVVCYEWFDARGNVHRSAPSFPKKGTALANGSVTLTIPSLSCSSKLSDASGAGPKVMVYRTTVNGAQSGPFYQLTTPDEATDLDFTAQSVTYFDDKNDISTGFDLSQNATLYTTGGVLRNVMPPCSSACVTHKNRVWMIADDGKTVWYSKAYVEGDGVAWSDNFTLPLEDGVKLTALASMDGNLVMFSRTRIYILQGTEGPNDQGLQSDIGTPLKMAADMGCIAAWSLVLTPAGILFQAPAGIYLLSRKLETAFIGQPVETTLAAYPTVLSAIVHPTGNYVQFVCAGAEYGVRLVYDYRVGQWAVDTIGTLGAGVKLGGECVSGGLVYTAGADGGLAVESSGYLDGGALWITMRAEVASIKLGGLQGYQRARHVHVLAERLTSHNLKVEVANDYSATYHQTFAWPWQDLDAMPREQTRDHLSQQKCQAVRVRITDSTPTGVGAVVGTGRGCSLKGLAFDVQQKSGAMRLPAQAKG